MSGAYHYRWAALGLAMALGACTSTSSSTPAPDQPRPPSTPILEVTMREYRFELPASLPAGRVVFRFKNAGNEPHRPALLRLDDDFPPIQEEVRNDTPRLLLPYAGIPTQRPGATGTFAVDLAGGGRYALVCFVSAPDGQGHAAKGMTWEARAGGGSTTPAPGTAKVAPETTTTAEAGGT